jgi:hypothetical protein
MSSKSRKFFSLARFASFSVITFFGALFGASYGALYSAASQAQSTQSSAKATSNSCQWEWLCDGLGSCKQTPICENLRDDPGKAPGGAPPKPPHSLPPFELPRAQNGLKCSHVQRFNSKNNRWKWDQACYCTENNESASPNRGAGGVGGGSGLNDTNTPQSQGSPLLGITRCEAAQRNNAAKASDSSGATLEAIVPLKIDAPK